MKAISDVNRIQAIAVFLEKPNTDLLSKDELIVGLQSMTDIRPLSPEAKQLYMNALEAIYKDRK